MSEPKPAVLLLPSATQRPGSWLPSPASAPFGLEAERVHNNYLSLAFMNFDLVPYPTVIMRKYYYDSLLCQGGGANSLQVLSTVH